MRKVRITMFLNDEVDEAFVSCVVREDGTLDVSPHTTDWLDPDALAEVMPVLANRLFPVEVLDEAGD